MKELDSIYNNVQCTFIINCVYILFFGNHSCLQNVESGQIRAIHIATLEKTLESSENSVKGVKILTIFLFFM